MTKNLMIATTLLFSSAQAHQSQLTTEHLSSYQAEFTYYTEQHDGTLVKAGIWRDSVTVTDTQIIRTVVRTPKPGETDLIRTVAANKPELSPAYINQRFGKDLQGVYYAELKQQKLTQFFLGNSLVPAKTSATDFGDPVVESNLQGVLAIALPFNTETDILVNSYVGGASPKSQPVTFHVAGQESLDVMGQEVTAWKVQEPNSRWTYWVRKNAPYLVKVSHPGSNGAMLVSILTHYTEIRTTAK